MTRNNGDSERRRLIADRLRAARRASRLTQAEVEGEVGIPRSGISDIETGKRGVTGLEVCRLARTYGRSVAWLVGEEEFEPKGTELLDLVEVLPHEARAFLLVFVRCLIEYRRYKGDSE
jgi:transcriptional regulator with XRE-family HTH domain